MVGSPVHDHLVPMKDSSDMATVLGQLRERDLGQIAVLFCVSQRNIISKI